MAGQDKILLRLSAANGLSLSTSVLKDGISISRSANFNWQGVINRSSGVCTYANTNGLAISVVLELIAHDAANWNAQDITECTKGLLALMMPMKTGTKPPPLVTVFFGAGTLLNSYSCVCDNVDAHPGVNNLYDSQTGDPLCSIVTVSLKGVELMAQSDTDWAGNSLRSYKNLSFGN